MDRSHTTLHKYSYNQLHFTVPGMGGVENVDMSSIYGFKKNNVCRSSQGRVKQKRPNEKLYKR